MTTSEFKFSFILQGRFNAEQQMDLSDNLIEAGCDYPEVSAHNDIITLEFFHEKRSDDYQKVILDEMLRVESTGVFISSLIESDAVTVSDIAERSGTNKMNISRYSRQQSGGEDFPEPAYGEKWSWAEVAEWLNSRGKLDIEDCKIATALKTTGNAIQIRAMMKEISVVSLLQAISKAA